MSAKHTLVINGKVYDAVSGLPVAAPDPVRIAPKPTSMPVAVSENIVPQPVSLAHRRAHLHATQAHATVQKSATLRRDVLKKPVTKPQLASARRKPTPGHVARSERIQRFAPHPEPLKTQLSTASKGIAFDITRNTPKPAAIVAQKHAAALKKSQVRPSLPIASTPALNSRSIKEQLIAERLAQVDTSTAKPESKTPRKRSGLFSRQPRLASLLSASLAVAMLGGYFTYLNMPGLSVRVAAAQADVAATFPDYHPDGYRFIGPVAFAPGQVAINFFANGGTAKYTVTEQKSTWDSQAVYDNIVAKVADDNYVTNSQQGLTIYTFSGEAAWVNKGILYTISGDAPLNNEQLLRIAASL